MTVKQITKNLQIQVAVSRNLSQERYKFNTDGLTVFLRTDDAERLVKYLKRKEKK